MPGDLSTEMGSAGASMTLKLAEALKDLVAKLFQLWEHRTSAEYRLSKVKLKEQKGAAAEERAVRRINGKVGFVRHKDLQRAGVPLTVTGIHCTEEELRKIAAACKRNGIVITAQDDVRSREVGGERTFVIECRQSDLTRFADLIDSLNDAKRIQMLEDEKQAVLSMGEAMTEEDRLYLEQLDREIAAIREGDCRELNEEQAKGEIEKAVNDGKTYSGVDLSEALDRWTGGEIDRETTCFVVDAKAPDRYIVVTAKNAEFNGEAYIKSTYDVYHGDTQVFSTHDGRFVDRPKNYWSNQKEAIQTEGGIGDTVIKFYDRAEMEAYKQYYHEQNNRELVGLEKDVAEGNYEAAKAELHEKLAECGAVYQDGIAVNKETGEPMKLQDGMSVTEQAVVAEATVCAEQIANYTKMEQLQVDVTLARADVLAAASGSREHAAAVVKLESLEKQFQSAKDLDAALLDRRKGVNFVQAEQERQGAAIEHGKELGGRPAPVRYTREQVKDLVKNKKAADKVVGGNQKVPHRAVKAVVKKTAKVTPGRE